MNLVSSLNQTRLQFCRSQSLTLLYHMTLTSRCRRLSTAPKKGRLMRKPFSRRRFPTLCRYSSETWISFLQHESCFIAEPDSPPVLQVPAPYSVAPSDPSKPMPTSQYCAKVRTSDAKAVFMETVSDCLCRYSSETWDI